MEKDLDKQLYDNYIKGNKKAFELLYNKYKKRIEYFIYNIVKDYQKAEDLSQEVFIYVMQHKLKENFTFKATLYLIAKSKAYNYINVENRRNEIKDMYLNKDSQLAEQDILEVIENEETKKEVLEAINCLDERYKNAIYLSKIENLSYEETSKILGESLQNTKNLIHRGKKQLHKILLRREYDNMNKFSKIIIIIILILFILGPVSVIATRYLLQYTKDGRLIIFSGQEIPEEIPAGTPIVIAIPANPPKQNLEELQRQEKENFSKMHSDLQNEVIKENEIDIMSLEEDEDSFVKVLKKYFGNDEIDNLYMKIDGEITDGNIMNENKIKTFTPTQKEVLDKVVEIINSTKATMEEKEILKGTLYKEFPYISNKTEDEDIIIKIKEAIGDYIPPPDDNPTK